MLKCSFCGKEPKTEEERQIIIKLDCCDGCLKDLNDFEEVSDGGVSQTSHRV